MTPRLHPNSYLDKIIVHLDLFDETDATMVSDFPYNLFIKKVIPTTYFRIHVCKTPGITFSPPLTEFALEFFSHTRFEKWEAGLVEGHGYATIFLLTKVKDVRGSPSKYNKSE